MKQPNIIVYFADQQRWDTCGCYGQPLCVTPHLDALAKEGTLFQNAFTCQPVCGPARACLQSGKYATQVGCFRNDLPLPTDTKSVAKYFNEAGYGTAYIGKWHLASDYRDPQQNYRTVAVPQERRGGYKDYWMASDMLEYTSHGYDGCVFDKENQKHTFVGYRADCINNYAIHYLKNRQTEKPFFMFISQIEPHQQNDHKCFEGPDGSKEKFENYEIPGDLKDTQGDWRENYPDYLGQCHSLDENLGKLITTLKEQGVWEDTILFYTADHGSHFRTRNQEYKRSCHESSIHVPMVACGGAFSGGKVIDQLVSLIDLPVTLLDCAGIAKPDDFQGQSLQALAVDETIPWKEEVFVQISESQIGRAIRTNRWKYAVRAVGNGKLEGQASVYYEEFLYDLENDPHEKNNLVADQMYVAIRKNLSERLIQNMLLAKEEAPVIQPAITSFA